jgi:uncharacterized protein (DUF433 family)
MEQEKGLTERITVNSKVMLGKPTIRGLRISVEQILRALSSGVTEGDLLAEYPELEPADFRAVIRFQPNYEPMKREIF